MKGLYVLLFLIVCFSSFPTVTQTNYTLDLNYTSVYGE